MAPWRRSAWPAAALLLAMLVPAHAGNCPGAKTQLGRDSCANHALAKANAALDSSYKTVVDPDCPIKPHP